MARSPTHILIVGAGAAGLMAGRELAGAGRKVTILEARDRCGGRILPLSTQTFGYPAEGGAEFIHGAAPVTRALMGEAGLAASPVEGRRCRIRGGTVSPAGPAPHADRLREALMQLETDLPIAEFLDRHFADPQYSALRHEIRRMVEGYDAADARKASTFALRDEWMGRGLGPPGRVGGGYGALITFLASECRRNGAAIRLGAAVTAIEQRGGRIAARCRDGALLEADTAIVTVPLPLLNDIELPHAAREQAAASADIGFGKVVKILLRFESSWWTDRAGRDFADLSFLFSDAAVPTWWTQYPASSSVLTGWFAGPRAENAAQLAESDLVDMGLASLAEIFGVTTDRLKRDLVASNAINWGNDPFARGAYCFATPETRQAQSVLRTPNSSGVLFSGEALYAGPDMGTVEAALASGRETAEMILAAG
jgi:monoamine oxidase